MSGHEAAVRVLVMARAPVPGLTKTRLAAVVGDVNAAELSAAALIDTLRTCRRAFGVDRCTIALAGSLDRAVGAEQVRRELAGWAVLSQDGETFADRLANAHGQVGGPLVQIGTDTPQATVEQLRDVVGLLRSADAVLGRAVDGGWWVLGLQDGRAASCLRDVPMSSPHTGELTLAALNAAGLSVARAPELRDVDVVADAEAVAVRAPWTEFSRRWRGLEVSV